MKGTSLREERSALSLIKKEGQRKGGFTNGGIQHDARGKKRDWGGGKEPAVRGRKNHITPFGAKAKKPLILSKKEQPFLKRGQRGRERQKKKQQIKRGNTSITENT